MGDLIFKHPVQKIIIILPFRDFFPNILKKYLLPKPFKAVFENKLKGKFITCQK